MSQRIPLTTYGAFEAKNKLSELLDLVEGGLPIVITRHGTPIARLVPYQESRDAERARNAVAGLKRLRKGMKLRGLSLRDLLREGRK